MLGAELRWELVSRKHRVLNQAVEDVVLNSG